MVSRKQMHRLATHPSEYHRFLTTGKLPQGEVPRGPLVDLLKSIYPQDRIAMIGVTIDPRLGYSGSRQFQTAEQALKWIAPSNEVFGSFPADSWRDKRRNEPLYLEDLLECCSKYPQKILERYPRLRRPQPLGAVETPDGETESTASKRLPRP